MADLSKLDWFANWQNGVSFLLAIGASIWLGPLDAAHFVFVFVIAFAAARVMTTLAHALWKRFGPR
jgi:hypothetical protein